MATEHAESTSRDFQRLIVAEHPTTGTKDDDDDRDDEHTGENEAPVREVDDEDELGHPEDDDADEDEGEK